MGCARADDHFKKKKVQAGNESCNLPPNPHKRGKSHHHDLPDWLVLKQPITNLLLSNFKQFRAVVPQMQKFRSPHG